ncbi:hypothetical protein [uncultured Corynebacterium sp.]|uniref:hypothetical protein n=1 Tax=uncultured Corynebacterium sp. TaxID=159447 RepID=UPI0025F76685|nr:hypothetical protein [uncultured Corynebacterium sp.]
MNEIDSKRAAMIILTRGKQLAPDRFPTLNAETAQAWADALRRYELSEQLWLEAVTVFCTEKITQRMVTPLDIIEAARAAKTRWEQSPEGRAAIAKARGEQPTTRSEIEAYYDKRAGQSGETPREYQQRVHPRVARIITDMVERRKDAPPYRAEPGHWFSPKKL